MKKNYFKLIFLLILMSTTVGYGQYSAETVLEKSFEQMDFFFAPDYLNPYGIGDFSGAMPGLMDDPLLNLMVNPAYLYTDSTYLYLDFRNHETIGTSNRYYPLNYYADYAVSDAMYWYPIYYIESRQSAEPVFSTALLTRPFKKWGKGISLGVTYKALLQDEDYYQVPYDIYRAGVGYDYAGNRIAEEADVPITDRYKGEDKMHQIGHFFSLFSSYDLANKLKLGMKLSRVLFEREGAFGSQNFWEDCYRQDYTSFWYGMEERDQEYDHWDFLGGLSYQLTERLAIGVKGGYLWGNATQKIMQEDSSLYAHGEINVGDDWSHYHKAGASEKWWDHNGKTYYGGIDLQFKIAPNKIFNFYYTYDKQNLDIYLRTAVSDTSYSNYHHVWDDGYYYSDADYRLNDKRSGTGDGSTTAHKFMGALQWQMERNKKLHLGMIVESQQRQLNTVEHVLADRHNRYYYQSSWENQTEYSYYESTVEDKTLYWDFDVKVTSIQIPIVFNWQASNKVELLLGMNRKMSTWEIDDVTLAIFKYRRQVENSTVKEKTNFGERYTQPEEKRTEIHTTFMTGMTISPSKSFNIRLLVVPHFDDAYDRSDLINLQWWIGLNLYP